MLYTLKILKHAVRIQLLLTNKVWIALRIFWNWTNNVTQRKVNFVSSRVYKISAAKFGAQACNGKKAITDITRTVGMLSLKKRVKPQSVWWSLFESQGTKATSKYRASQRKATLTVAANNFRWHGSKVGIKSYKKTVQASGVIYAVIPESLERLVV